MKCSSCANWNRLTNLSTYGVCRLISLGAYPDSAYMFGTADLRTEQNFYCIEFRQNTDKDWDSLLATEQYA